MDDSDFYLDGDPSSVAAEVPPPVAPQQPRGKPKPSGTAAAAADGTPFYFDLETVPDDSRLASFALPEIPPAPDESDCPSLPAPATLLIGTADEIKQRFSGCFPPTAYLDDAQAAETAGKARKGVLDIIAKARSARQDALNAHADRCKLLSTCPEYCQIAAIGVAIGSGPVQGFVVGVDGVDEVDILEAFWDRLPSCQPLVGYNIIGFDLPVIYVRSCLLGIPATKMLDLSPWNRDICDVYLRRFGARGNTSRDKPGKLKQLAPLYGIEVPAGDCDGSQVYDLMQTPEGREKVREYVVSDVTIVRQMHTMLAGYFWE